MHGMQTWKYPLVGGAVVLILFVAVIASCRHRTEKAPGIEPPVPGGELVVPSPETSVPVATEQQESGTMLSDAQWAWLQQQGWEQRAGAGMGIWISVDEQVFRLIEGGKVLWEVPCSTAARGTGSVVNSMQTPLGWHVVKSKTGAGAPWGQVFRSGHATAEVWKPGQTTKEDLVLTRVLFLDGLEPGRNKGGDVDSFDRKIYIHGTNDEVRIGTPTSHGCIRLRNDDVIAAYERIPDKTPVLISERKP